MKLVVRQSAAQALNNVTFGENEGVRIEAIFVGSCSIYVDHYLWIDVKGEDDLLKTIDGIPFLISSESAKHLPDILYVDYNPTLGYKLSSDEETYKFNLRLTRK